MHIHGAYSPQNLWGVQESQRVQTNGRGRHTSTSGGDTVSISPEAQAHAKAVRKQAQITQTPMEEFPATTVQEPAAQESAVPSSPYFTAGVQAILDAIAAKTYDVSSMKWPKEASFLTKLKPWSPPEEGTPPPRTKVLMLANTPDEQEYLDAMYKIYQEVRWEMGLGGDVRTQVVVGPNVSEEQFVAFQEEVVRRMRADERINSLMEKFGINEQLDGTRPYITYTEEEMGKHFHFMTSMFDAYQEGKFSAEELGKIMAQYARGEITADDVDAVLTQYASIEGEEGNLRDLLSVSVDAYQKSWQDDEDIIRLLKEDEHINHLMQQIGV